MKVVFMGTPAASVPALEMILKQGHQVVAVWTQPDRPAGRGNKLSPSPVKEFALQRDLEVFQPKRIKTVESLDLFRSHRADLAIVVAYGRILPQTFLEAFPKGAINVHFSLLPKYRGAAPVNWAIVNGERKTGITTMKMDAGLDTGDILLQSETEILESENAVELMLRLSQQGARLLCETLQKLDEITPREQDHRKSTLAPMLSKEDGLIDWRLNAKTIKDRVRGFQPFPRSFTSYQNQKLTIWEAVEVEIEDAGGKNVGEVLASEGDHLSIKCGENTVLRIAELQIQGKRRMGTRDFLNGVNLEKGEILGL